MSTPDGQPIRSQPLPPPGYVLYGPPGVPGAGDGATTGRSNGFGVASMVLGIVGVAVPYAWLVQVPGLLAAVLGLVSLRQFKTRPGVYRGRAMAVAGVVLGIVGLVLFVGVWLVVVWALSLGGSTGD